MEQYEKTQHVKIFLDYYSCGRYFQHGNLDNRADDLLDLRV